MIEKTRGMFVILGVTGGLWGCPKEAPIPEARTVAAASTDLGVTGLGRDTAQKFLCSNETGPCVLTDLKAAGDSAKKWYVAEVAYVSSPDADGAWKSPTFDGADGCNRWALFGVEANGDKVLGGTKLESLCNDGHGASGVGEDHWEVEGGRLTVTTNGGSNWRWGTKTIYDLKENTVVYRDTDNYFATNPNVTEFRSWDFENFAGKISWATEVCGESEPVEQVAYSIAKVSLPAAFVESGWKTTSLGSCASAFDATAVRGFVIHGQKSGAEDTAMKVVASTTGELFVEVTDDMLVPSSTGKWIHADHLELWLSPDEPEKMNMDCVERRTKKTWQWGIDANSGVVHVAHGKPTQKLVAERVATKGGVRFKISIPAEAKSITVVYSDSDDGKTQERLLATSAFKFGNLETMGEFNKIAEEEAVCVLAGESLVAKIRPRNSGRK